MQIVQTPKDVFPLPGFDHGNNASTILLRLVHGCADFALWSGFKISPAICPLMALSGLFEGSPHVRYRG
jgi:hypothetical protein